nr:molybdopterin-dependent oxidoreductase [bacterium]
TMIMGVVLEKCAKSLKGKLFDFASKKFGAPASSFLFEGDSILSKERRLMSVSELVRLYLKEEGPLTVLEHYELPPGVKWDEENYRGDAYPTFAWGCDVAEVEIDMDTFEIRVVKMWLAQDIGRAINPKMAAGQIEGGTLQALGYALMERHAVSRGRLATNRLQNYIIPTTLDAPEMETIIVEEPFSFGPMGAKGVGELPMDGGAPAVANAVANATGLSVCDLPITPERLYEAWRKRGG